MTDERKKLCWKCKEEKSLSEFARSGKDSACKKCRYGLNSEWAKTHREELRSGRAQYMREYRAKKRQKIN
jgi:hypothetical protein